MLITNFSIILFSNVPLQLNTFQVVLVANRRESYVVFNYGDIAWTTGQASGGTEDGLGGIPAEVG